MKQLYILLFLAFLGYTASAQTKNSITGKVVDQDKAGLELVNIKVIETNQLATTNKSGVFTIDAGLANSQLTLEFSYIGFQRLRLQVQMKQGKMDMGIIQLKTLDLSLKTIDINAKRNYEGSSNSSLIITRDIIEQIPALSVNDLLNLLPNRKISPPSLQNVQNVTLRSTFAETTSGRGAFELNNSFGVAILIDGDVISNNANMQGYNPGLRGMGGSTVTSGNSYGLKGTGTTSYSGDYTFGGTDLRQIPADNIESIEIISGVAPAKYGDLTDGAVIIERQAGAAPAYFRMQLRDNATSYSLSKGVKLTNDLGALNLGMNYVNSFEDNRDKLKAYRRINASAMWTNSYGKEKQLKNTFSLDYGRNLDGIKRDPDDPKSTATKFNSWNFRVSNRSSYRVKSDFLKNVSLNFNYSQSHQVSYDESLVNLPFVAYTDAVVTGITKGYFDSGIYTATSLIDGRPVNFSTRLDFNSEFKTGNLIHYLSFGANYNYAANKGLGQTIDPNAPRETARTKTATMGASGTERYYNFNLGLVQQDFGFYTEDMFKAKLFGRDLNVRAGMRFDLQNNYASFAPRTNLSYQLSNDVKIGLAYGLAYKSPGLAQRYPGPTFYDIPLLAAYNGNAAESVYMVYVNRYDPTNKNLKSSRSQTIELSTQIKLDDYNLSVSAFSKNNRNGINTIENYVPVTLPTYSATIVPGQPAKVIETGTQQYVMNFFSFSNNLSSDNQGFEAILTTPEIKSIFTSFNLSGGFYRTAYQGKGLSSATVISGTSSANPNVAIIGFYPPQKFEAYFSNGRITATTHIPKVSLILQLIAEFDIMKKTVADENTGIPVAYINRNGDYVNIDPLTFDKSNALYGHLYKSASERKANDLPRIYSNYHLSIGKEIRKRFRFSFNVYNVFNYQPYYINSANEYRFPNSAPTFGAELSLKL